VDGQKDQEERGKTHIFSHRIPLLLLTLISQNIIRLCSQENKDDKNVNGDEIPVSAAILRRVIGSVDEVCYNVAELDAHCERLAGAYIGRPKELTVINGGRNGAISDIVGILGCPCPIHPQISISLSNFLSE